MISLGRISNVSRRARETQHWDLPPEQTRQYRFAHWGAQISAVQAKRSTWQCVGLCSASTL